MVILWKRRSIGPGRRSDAGVGECVGEASRPDDQRAEGLDSIALVERYRAGDRAALELLFERYAGRVARIVRVRSGELLRAREDLADLVQDVLLKMCRDLDHYEVREDARFVDWAATLCERTLRNRVRHHRAEKRDAARRRPLGRTGSADGDDGGASDAWDVAASAATPLEQLDGREREELVDTCLRELRDEHREVILLRDFAGASWEYVAASLARPSTGAAQQLHRRARIALGDLLKRRGL